MTTEMTGSLVMKRRSSPAAQRAIHQPPRHSREGSSPETGPGIFASRRNMACLEAHPGPMPAALEHLGARPEPNAGTGNRIGWLRKPAPPARLGQNPRHNFFRSFTLPESNAAKVPAVLQQNVRQILESAMLSQA